MSWIGKQKAITLSGEGDKIFIFLQFSLKLEIFINE